MCGKTGLFSALVAVWGIVNPAFCADVQFNQDILPILSNHCFHCHGPDSASREADLRLDLPESLEEIRGEFPIVKPGDHSQSELYKRITSHDPDLKMPPDSSAKPLTAKQIELLKAWIDDGAPWEAHWSFLPIESPTPPDVANADWVRSPIDSFVLDKLNRQGLQPSPEAPAEVLVRRLFLDLTGLPPSHEEVEEFCADRSPDRYERLVDRLLASPEYGEHLAVDWLDAARFSDTSGYQNDGPRYMWRWRDWVINAYNSGMPFDQFTIEQLAGDLLPNPTLDQLIATGFNRNHRGNSEGGSLPEEFAVEYVVDRVDTTSTVWLGLTVACARCHDHKYDPISQQDYYQLYAYFNNVPESGRAIKEGNSPPYIKAPTPDQARQLAIYDAAFAEAQQAWEAQQNEAEHAQAAWEASLQTASAGEERWTITNGLLAHYPLEGDLNGVAPAGIPLTVSSGEPEWSQDGRPGLRFDGPQYLDAGKVAHFHYMQPFSVSAWVKPDGAGSLTGGIISKMTDDAYAEGWALHLEQGKVQVNIVKRWLDDSLRVETQQPLKPDQWQHVLFTYDGSRTAKGVHIYVDGVLQEQIAHSDTLNQTPLNPDPLRIGSTGTLKPFQGSLSDVRVYERALRDFEAQIVSVPESVRALAAIPKAERSGPQLAKLKEYFLTEAAPEQVKRSYADWRREEKIRNDFHDSLPTTMVMQDLDEPRQTHILARGSYDLPTTPVSARVPEVFEKTLPAEGNRLDFARWLVDPRHPLTSRVTVNREWQRLFGLGLVKSSEDLGAQGERPSHPELLDWLATELIRSGWNFKAIQKEIVLSATYRQSSDVSPELVVLDPENRLLARGPRFRLSAEAIRDRALAVSGLLQHAPGGPSVKPYQPDGLWSQIATDTEYVQSRGPDLYRRSLYSYSKRTVANPSMVVFDGTTREACIVRRSRTNTPLQALTLMNDVTYVEAARVLAENVLAEGAPQAKDRIESLVQTALGREPDEQEERILLSSLESYLRHFQTHADEAQALLRVGDFQADPRWNPTELAAYSAIASIVMNLDEFVSKD